MKKFYFLLTLLLSVVGIAQVSAQDNEVEIAINMNGGDWVAWNGNAGNPWARSWYSSEATTPRISVCSKNGSNSTTDIRGNGFSGANNMSTWGSSKSDIMFFTKFGGSDATYEIMVAEGWYISSVEFDFNCANNNDADDGSLKITVDGEEYTSSAKDDNQHIEWTNDDEEIYSMQFVVARIEGTYNFARTSNFIVKVCPMDPLVAAEAEMMDVYDKYSVYSQEGTEPFTIGTEPGNYSEEAVTAFEEALFACTDEDNWPEVTVEFLQSLIDNIKSTYEAVLASKAPMTLTDGYYRFRTAINYNDGNAKYMYIANNTDGTISGRWGTIEDLDNDCPSLWQIKNAEDGKFDIISVATDARFNDNPATLSVESEHLMKFEPVTTIEGVTYVNILYANAESGSYNYIHQAGHGSGAGTGSNLTKWVATYPTTLANKMGASEWIIEAVDADVAAAIIEAYAPIKDRDLMEKNYQEMVAKAKDMLLIAKDDPTITVNDEVKLITSAEQLSSPWTDSSEGTDIGALLDEDLATFWHSNWHNGAVAVHTHYLDVALSKPSHELISMIIRRRQVANNHTTKWSVYGSTTPDVYYVEGDDLPEGKQVGDLKEAGEWHKLAELSTPYSGDMEEIVQSLPFDTKGYQYLRFYIDGNMGGSGLCHMSEFQLSPATVEIAEKAQYNVMGEIATNLEAVLDAQIEIVVKEMTVEQYNTLKTAYDAFAAKFVDPAELRAAIKKSEASAAGIVVGNNPGEWGPETDAGALKTLLDNAKAYDASGDYNAETSADYIENLGTLSGDILGSANTIQEGKWYRIRFASEELFDETGWDKVAGKATVSQYDETLVTDEALWSKYVTVAKNVEEKQIVQVAKEDETTEDKEVTVNSVVPYDEEEEVIGINAALFFDADEDITNKDLALFRFVGVGDTAYVIQNKATGLFIKCGTTGGTVLSIQPSLFNVSAIGYGENLIAASNLINGTKQNYLHGQKSQNRLVTWNATVAGSASGMFIEEVEDVAGDYDGTAFFMNLKPGSVNTFCYPVDIKAAINEDTDEPYALYDVTGVSEEGVITLNPLEEMYPGRPFIFIADGEYDAEATDDEIAVPFIHGYSFTTAAVQAPFLKGTYSTISELEKGVLALKDNAFVPVKSNISAMEGLSVPANGAYIAGESQFPLDVEYSFEIDATEDGIAATLTKVAHSGAIYTIDGRLVSKSGNLNTLKRLGKGTYILNGTKVVVK